ncbi:hypothetical protein OPQ81_011165 [Rhizoctonia solani]|nr:hypothetical protein OPQ81_011165 [Rhizoctonia solani]
MLHMHPVLKPPSPDAIHKNYPYATNIGHLLWLAHTIRPDIMFVVCLLTQFTNTYNDFHVHVMKCIFQFLAGTSHIDLVFDGKQPFNLVAYSDSDFGQQYGRKSISGSIVLLGGTVISWFSSKQHSVSLSMMEAECMALAKTAQEVISIRSMLYGLGYFINRPTTILCDNAAAISFSNNPTHCTQAKHIDLQFQFVQDKINNSSIVIGPIPSRDNLADAFTKALPYARFWRLANDYLGTRKVDYRQALGMHFPIWHYHDDLETSIQSIR